ncbi:MAG: MerR family transcriptional regulator [Lachnospiraceae bacterium]
MLKIGEFSKLAHLTIKALRFYEKEGLLIPAFTDAWTGYRFYETNQLEDAARIKSYRQLGLSIDEIKEILSGKDVREIFAKKAEALKAQREDIDARLSIIRHILEEDEMKYQVAEKLIPGKIVYYSETVLDKYEDIMTWIPELGNECMRLNPGLKCAEPAYEYCEYLDGEYMESGIRIRHSEAVCKKGVESERIKFREMPEIRVLSIYHKGPYDRIGEAYAYISKYAKENGYTIAGLARECYIDGIWNKESPEEWLTEIQLPVK